jgi:prepilin signal peptidase PulO-like enzyme (type II secretory pathway)
VKLIVGIGALLGLALGLSAVILGFWIGAIWSVYLLINSKNKENNAKVVNMSSEVPFAPFLIVGTFIAFVLSIDVLHIGTFLGLFLNN